VTSRTAVVPYGFGLGDTINMRPLLQSIVESRPGSEISVLCPPAFESLLPDGVRAMHSIRGMPLWQRPNRESLVERVLRAIPKSVVRHSLSPRAARSLSFILNHQGFGEVLNLLETLCGVDLDARWTDGPWNVSSGHVIDTMADMLELHGIDIPRARRRPVLPVGHTSIRSGRRVALNPNAGSGLKEASAELWATIARALLAAGYLPLVLSGYDSALAARVVRLAPQTEHVVTPNVEALKDLLMSVQLLVSPDTGVLHPAAALGMPYIGLFGSTNPEFLGPYGAAPEDIIVSPAPHFDICRGCWKAQLLLHGDCAVKYDPGCLSAIKPDAVLERIFAKLTVPSQTSHLHISRAGLDEPRACYGAPRGVAPR
jgi:ADP-heptose:LPS heptosyltransferase